MDLAAGWRSAARACGVTAPDADLDAAGADPLDRSVIGRLGVPPAGAEAARLYRIVPPRVAWEPAARASLRHEPATLGAGPP